MTTTRDHVIDTRIIPIMKTIYIASRSEIKGRALCAALNALGLNNEFISFHYEVASGAHAQPYGDIETIHGALHRSSILTSKEPDSYVVAIENGVVWRRDSHVDLAYVVVASPNGRLTIRHSDNVLVPGDLVVRSLASNWSVTCGQFEAQRSGCDPADPHVVWSGGTTSRLELLTKTVTEALHVALEVA